MNNATKTEFTQSQFAKHFSGLIIRYNSLDVIKIHVANIIQLKK